MLGRYVQAHGRPLAVYTDKASLFQTAPKAVHHRQAPNNIPVLGVCECCNAEFAADPETIGRPKDAHAHIQKQFIAHKCKRLNASQNAVRMVSGGAK